MAFFSLAGWAEGPIDLSAYKVVIGNPTAIYTGANRASAANIYLENKSDASDKIYSGFKVKWSPSDPINVSSQGYTVTVDGDMTNTYNTPTQATGKFFVLKATATATATPTTPTSDLEFDGTAQKLITNTPAPTADFPNRAEGVAAPTIMYKVNDGEWSTTIPTATNPGTYAVYYKVVETDNYTGVPVDNNADGTKIADVILKGTPQSGYTAPSFVETALAFRWNNSTGAAIDQALITAGTVDATKGTMYYSFKSSTISGAKWSDWSTSVPVASDADSYTVKWKIVGVNGNADVAETTLSGTKAIAPVTPVVTAAKGATTLQYTGEDQALLTTPGSATFGATSVLKYTVKYKATVDGTYGSESAATEYADVKGNAAGYYEIKTYVPAGGNYNLAVAEATTTVAITKPSIFTVAPAAADLTWNNDDQQLITATEKEDGVAKYYLSTSGSMTTAALSALSDAAWKAKEEIIANNAGKYYVYYKVNNSNYQVVEPTLIPNVQIKKKVLSVKVNDITRDYDGTSTLAAPTAGKFTFVTRIEHDGVTPGSDLDFSGVAYVAQTNKNAGTYTGAVTVTEASLNAISENYEYAIIPGNLTINKLELTVAPSTDPDDLTTVYGTSKDISKAYTIVGYAPSEGPTNAFTTLPVLTSDAPANPEVGEYNLSFTEGTLKADANYTATYTIPATAKFTVTADLSRKLVITVLPHKQQYTGVAEDWTNMVVGTDYAVTGLVSGDAIVTAPTFSRSDATNFNVGTYNLTATIDENTIVADKTKYPGGIIVNNSTFTIEPRELTATVNQQTVLKDATVLPDLNAWSVDGMQNGEDVSTLKGVLQLVGSTAATGSIANGIKLIIDNDNYTLKTGTEYGTLLVISADQFVLDPADASLASQIQAAGTGKYSIQFGSWPMNAKEWYAVVLPFKTSPAELVAKLGTYVIANRLKSSSIKDDGEVVVNFGVEMDEIPAGEPFLIKAADDKNWNVTAATGGAFTGKVIAKTISDVVTDKATFTGTYEAGNIVHWGYGLDGTTADADAKYRWLAHKEYKGDNNWKNPKSNAHDLAPMEAFLILDAAAVKARIYVEDIDENGTTAIKSLSVDDVNGLNVKGWYTVGGMKMQNAPTQKGVYIKDGKKVIIK